MTKLQNERTKAYNTIISSINKAFSDAFEKHQNTTRGYYYKFQTNGGFSKIGSANISPSGKDLIKLVAKVYLDSELSYDFPFTVKEWKAIKKDEDIINIISTVIYCADGDVRYIEGNELI